MNRPEYSIAQMHVDNATREIMEYKAMSDAIASEQADEGVIMTQIREKVAKLCQKGDSGIYDDPAQLMLSLQKMGINPENDTVGQWLSMYHLLQESIDEHGGLITEDAGSLTALEFANLVGVAKEEYAEWETKTKLEKFERKRDSLYCKAFGYILRDEGMILERYFYEESYKTGILFWKNLPPLPELLKSEKIKGASARFDKILLAAQGEMYVDLLTRSTDTTEIEKILSEWEAAQDKLLPETNA